MQRSLCFEYFTVRSEVEIIHFQVSGDVKFYLVCLIQDADPKYYGDLVRFHQGMEGECSLCVHPRIIGQCLVIGLDDEI